MRYCTRYDRGTVTRIVSPQTVEVDGMARHVRDLRVQTRVDNDTSDWDALASDIDRVRSVADEDSGGNGLRRSARIAARAVHPNSSAVDSDEND